MGFNFTTYRMFQIYIHICNIEILLNFNRLKKNMFINNRVILLNIIYNILYY